MTICTKKHTREKDKKTQGEKPPTTQGSQHFMPPMNKGFLISSFIY